MTYDANFNGEWDEGDTFIDVSDGTRVYGFLSRDGTNELSKNIFDTNNNGNWDTRSKVIAYYDIDGNEGLKYNDGNPIYTKGPYDEVTKEYALGDAWITVN